MGNKGFDADGDEAATGAGEAETNFGGDDGDDATEKTRLIDMIVEILM